MKPLSWDEYYDRFYEWAPATRVRYLDRLTNIGPADEVTQVVLDLFDEKASTKLLRFGLGQGIHFSFVNVIDLCGCIDYKLIDEIALTISEPLSEQQLDELFSLVSEDVYIKLTHANGYKTAEEKEEERLDAELAAQIVEPQQPIRIRPHISPLGFLFHMWSQASEDAHRTGNSVWKTLTKNRQHQCNGDCANCPAHYGYREGRWYYGHHHSYGCEFGGNKGL